MSVFGNSQEMSLGAYLLVGAGAIFALLFALNNLIKTILRRGRIGFVDLLLTFMTALILLVGLVLAHLPDAAPDGVPDARIAQAVLLIGGALAAISLIVLIAELFRSQRLRGSRGVLGLYSGVLLMVAAFAVPFMGAYVTVQEIAAAPTVVGVVPTLAATAEASASTPDQPDQTALLFKAISAAVVDEIDVDPGIVTDALQNGTPLAQIVTENGGSVDHVIDAITEIMRASVRELAARGEINAFQAAIALSQMPNLIRLAVNSDLNAFAARLSGSTPDPNATPTNLFAFATEATTPAAPAPTATHQPKRQSSPTASPTRTNTPRSVSLTPTPSATRFHYSTRTPTPTFTAVTPCLASVEYNLRLRSAPDTDSETLAVIDYGTTVELYGKGGASANGGQWWYAHYDDQEGWLDGHYMIVGAGCDRLPLR